MKGKYPVLDGLMRERKIKGGDMAKGIGGSERAMAYKLDGTTHFKWEEVERMQRVFFPDKSKEELLKREEGA